LWPHNFSIKNVFNHLIVKDLCMKLFLKSLEDPLDGTYANLYNMQLRIEDTGGNA
jgi:hypothetical protein